MDLADRRAHASKCYLCVQLCSGGKICNLSKLELTLIIILQARSGELGSSVARVGPQLGGLK